MRKEKLSRSWNYVIVTYITFAVMVLGICGVASMVFHAGPLVMRILSNICAWSPTIVLFAGFRYWYSDISIRDYFKRVFAGKVKGSLLAMSIASTGLTSMVAIYIYALIKQVPVTAVFTIGGTSLALNVLLSFLSGPTGEECGWRGYLRYEFAQKYGFMKGNLLVGLVWTFWHAVLWVVDSDFTSGEELVIYILSNVVVITAMHMIMAVILEKEDNIIYAILVHFFFNLPYCMIDTDITFYIIIMPLYVLVAGGLCVYRRK